MKRNFLNGPTEEELKKYESITNREFTVLGYYSGIRKAVPQHEIPEACRRCKELFPNEWLDPVELRDVNSIKNKSTAFSTFIKSANTEREILNYIKINNLYCAIGSILRAASIKTGHHATYVFPEFQLSNIYQADYLIVGRGSGGHEFVFVEFESPTGSVTLQDGTFGEVFRKGIKQVENWDRFLQSEFSSLLPTFNKYKYKTATLPEEFYKYDSSRIHYVVIAGKRSDFSDATYRLRREYKQRSDISILHFDNLVDSFTQLANSRGY